MRVRVIIRGRVIGVFFRTSLQQRALKVGVRGFVENKGRDVVAVLQGPKECVQELIEYCREGPEGAEVDEVEVHEEDGEDFSGFDIR